MLLTVDRGEGWGGESMPQHSSTTNSHSPGQNLQLSASPEFATRRVARLAGCARTLMGSYRSGGVRSEFVRRGSGAAPRYFTLRECARLQVRQGGVAEYGVHGVGIGGG